MKVNSGCIYLVFYSFTASAFPLVHDQVISVMKAKSGNISRITQTVTSVDLSHQQFKYSVVTELNGVKKTKDETGDIADMNYLMQSASSLSACSAWKQGVLESLVFLGKTIMSCHVHLIRPLGMSGNQSVDIWFGNVPFGVIKENIQGVNLVESGTIELESYSSKASEVN